MNIIKNNSLIMSAVKAIGIVSAIATTAFTVWYVLYKETNIKIFTIIVLIALLLISIITIILLNNKLKECELKNKEDVITYEEQLAKQEDGYKKQHEKLNDKYTEVCKNRDYLANTHEDLHKQNERLERQISTLRMFWMYSLTEDKPLKKEHIAEISTIIIEGDESDG